MTALPSFCFLFLFFFSSSSRCVAPNCCYRCDPVVPRLPACIFYNRLLFQTARVSDHREQSVSMRPPLDDFVQPHDRAWDKVQTFYSCASAAIQHLTVLGNHSQSISTWIQRKADQSTLDMQRSTTLVPLCQPNHRTITSSLLKTISLTHSHI